MDSLIPTINKLQNVFNTIGSECLQLPQIVVVGTQSSGKSSVIENLVGRSFLPRGVGIVTRRPLILQLINVANNEKNADEDWGVFLHKDNKVFKDFQEIRREIETETNAVAGANKGVSDKPISLQIHSKRVVNLTLIDLPGLTKVPVGDQPPDIQDKILQMVLKYIKNPNAIILAVVTANTDMATSESLQLARDCDPNGTRTVAVVTKLDLMDCGTDATEILTGRVIPVRLGIVGVVNRSQKDTQDRKPIKNAIRDEEKFLRKFYPAIARRHGTPFLAKTLNQILVDHIKDCLPNLKTRVSQMKARAASSLVSYGEDVTDGSKILLQIITRFCTAYCSSLDGTSRRIETTELSGGARICFIFHETFGKTLESIKPLLGLAKLDILTAMRNATGTRPALFVPEVCFEILVKRQIARLLDPSIRCVDLIHDEMRRIVQQCTNEMFDEAARFPFLFDNIVSIVSRMLKRRLPDTYRMVENLINIELAYINTLNPEFRREADIIELSLAMEKKTDNPEKQEEDKKSKDKSSGNSVSSARLLTKREQSAQSSGNWLTSLLPIHYHPPLSPAAPTSQPDLVFVPEKSPPPAPPPPVTDRRLTERESRECHVIESLVSIYFTIVRRSVQDNVPKAIMFCFVNSIKEGMNRELVEKLYKPENYHELLHEPEHIAERRVDNRRMLAALDNAEAIINEIHEVHSFDF